MPRPSASAYTTPFHFHIRSPLPMTGADAAVSIAGSASVKMTLGRDCYHPATGTVYLSESTWRGRDAPSLFRALHEAAHFLQHRERPWWFALRHFKRFRLSIERDAWRRAEEWMREMGYTQGTWRDEKKLGLESYERWRPAQ